jgi:hypothetical protein
MQVLNLFPRPALIINDIVPGASFRDFIYSRLKQENI